MAFTVHLRGTVRIDVRASVQQKELIQRAAKKRCESVTDFVVSAACREAEQTLANKNRFGLPPDKWKAFLEALDRPPRIKPELQKLFSEPSIREHRYLLQLGAAGIWNSR
jgi:uncharacterized protein (DUF1778 family)